jgi:hypothetical protein
MTPAIANSATLDLDGPAMFAKSRGLLVGLLTALVCVAACGHSSPTPGSVTPKDSSTTTWTRTVERTLHGDVDFSEEGRRRIRRACARWSEFTQGRAKLDVVFDLDFDDVLGLRTHQLTAHDVIIGVTSNLEIVKVLEARTHTDPAKITLLGATSDTVRGAKLVYLIMDRIDPEDFEAVVLHELGHVLGLPDLPTIGSLMSATAPSNARLQDFTEDDSGLCRAAHLCL